MKHASLVDDRLLLIPLCLGLLASPAFAQTNPPLINAVSPVAGAPGTSVTINGQNFNPVAASNVVYFGAVQAAVTLASTTSLTANVPAGATYVPVTVTTGGLTASSALPFLPTFPGSGGISSGSLGQPFTLPTGISSGSSTVADLDGDGRPDLIVVADDQHIYIYQNISTNRPLGTASFAPPLALPIPVLHNGNFGMIQAVDLTGDGKLDLVTADFMNSELVVLKNVSTPGGLLTTNSFAPAVFFPTGPTPFAVAVADLDGDGKPEIVTGGAGNAVWVFRNISTPGVFNTNSLAAPVTFTVKPNIKTMVLADMDGDGKPDMVTANNLNGGNQAMTISQNLSTPGHLLFGTNVVFAAPTGSYAVAVGDLDGDGKLDVVVGSQNAQTISIFRNTSSPGSISAGSLAPRVDFHTGGWANSLAIGDLDGDGKPDIAVVEQLPSQMEIFRNTSHPGSFSSTGLATPVTFGSGYNPISINLADLDGDGRPDIAFPNDYDGTVTFYQNLALQAGPPAITQQPASQTVISGSPVSFSAALTGSGALSCQWNFNGTNIIDATNAILSLAAVTTADAGFYQLTVTNAYGSVTSTKATLTVVLPPNITQQPQSLTVLTYNPATMNVGVNGTGPITYQWRKNGANLSDGGNVSGTATPQLTLASVTLSDAGNYDVLITTPYASTNSTVAVLTVPETVVSLGVTNTLSGGLITVPVWLNALGVENIFSGSIGYDPAKLVLQSVLLGQAATGAYLAEVDSLTNHGQVGFAIYFSSVLPAGNQPVAQLVFQALPVTNTAITALAWGDAPTTRQLVDANANSLPLLTQDGSVTLGPAEYEADVYPRFAGDHQLNLQDWLEIGRMVAGLDTPTNSDELLRADCAPRNAPDGVLTVADWVQAGRYALGLDPLTLVGAPGTVTIQPVPLGGFTSLTRTLQIASVSSLRGQSVSVPVQLVCTNNENAAGLTVNYNPAMLKLTGVTLGSAMAGGRLNINTNSLLGKVGLVLALPPGSALPVGTNQVAVLQFTAGTNAWSSQPLTLDGSLVKLQVADKSAGVLSASYVNGAVVLPPAPALQATGSGKNITLSWPVGQGNWQVVSAASPTGPWQPVAALIATNGLNTAVSVPATNHQQYFRLLGQ